MTNNVKRRLKIALKHSQKTKENLQIASDLAKAENEDNTMYIVTVKEQCDELTESITELLKQDERWKQ